MLEEFPLALKSSLLQFPCVHIIQIRRSYSSSSLCRCSDVSLYIIISSILIILLFLFWNFNFRHQLCPHLLIWRQLRGPKQNNPGGISLYHPSYETTRWERKASLNESLVMISRREETVSCLKSGRRRHTRICTSNSRLHTHWLRLQSRHQ